jgi:hypothetical protein
VLAALAAAALDAPSATLDALSLATALSNLLQPRQHRLAFFDMLMRNPYGVQTPRQSRKDVHCITSSAVLLSRSLVHLLLVIDLL